ncbi:MAG: nucleotidyl transferase AbiEii/AbiGii toxin family protein [Candidatus Blackburnbacteria bacterium]|nr:nucleotidyl transferase AbiEii/AbiGii toxin family protein [Candidatus Blackburnbacteria bacterium]
MLDKVLTPKTRSLLKSLGPQSLPKGIYLGGGTAVALQLGHRQSFDLDFFTPTKFIETQWEQNLSQGLSFKLIQRDWQTLIGTAGQVKLSLFGYKYKLIGKLEKIYQIPVVSLPDLAAMKLETVIGRGTKRDFIDIYFLAQKYGLKKIFSFYQKKYGNLEERELMLKKGLIFFDDADKDEMPEMLVGADWGEIKKWILHEVRNLS